MKKIIAFGFFVLMSKVCLADSIYSVQVIDKEKEKTEIFLQLPVDKKVGSVDSFLSQSITYPSKCNFVNGEREILYDDLSLGFNIKISEKTSNNLQSKVVVNFDYSILVAMNSFNNEICTIQAPMVNKIHSIQNLDLVLDSEVPVFESDRYIVKIKKTK